MNIGANGKVLATATKELFMRWQETKHSWRDVKALEFERKYMVELEGAVDRVAPVFDDLDKLVGKVRSDCE
jgi:hypothetical protein